MASSFGHACLAGALGIHLSTQQKTKLIVLGIICSAIPDLDILAFDLGIPYSHMFGHRGFTHSLFFAFFWSLIIQFAFLRRLENRWLVFLYLFVCTASHGLLDAMTTGGRGIAFFAPFSAERYFLPWRVIQVSPLSASDFFGDWGIRVIQSELLWIGIPSLIIAIFPALIRQIKKVAVK